MRKIGASKVRNQLRQLLDWVEAGEELVITRRARIVARLVPTGKQAGEAAVAIRAMSKGVTLGGLKAKDLVAEGRR